MRKSSKLKKRSTKIHAANGKPWGKGHSSDSNSKITKFRDLASKVRFSTSSPAVFEFHEREKTDKITDKLLKNDEKMFSKLNLDDESDRSTAETADTKFSHFTNCTNPTFNRVHRLWKSGSSMQNDVLTVLAAVTDIIKNGGGRETEVEYFAALMTALANDEQSTSNLAATAYLLSLVIKKVPYAVLAAKFSEVSQIFYSRFARCAQTAPVSDEDHQHCHHENHDHHHHDGDDSSHNALLRYLIVNVGVLLKAQPRLVWESASTASMLHGLLNFVVDQRPKIRRTSQLAVSDLLHVDSTAPPHPAAKIVASFSVETLERCGGQGKNVHSTFYVLHLLEKCLCRFNANSLKSTAETLLKLMTLASPLVLASTLHCFYAMFAARPADASLNVETTCQLIMALFDFEPPKNDTKPRINWLNAVVEAHICLKDKDQKICATFTLKTLESLVNALAATTQSDVVSATVAAIKRLLSEILPELRVNKAIDEANSSKLASTMQSMLSYQFYSMWPRCFDILSTFFAVATPIAGSTPICPKSLLRSMAELRESENFAFSAPLEKAFGSAIRHLGPESVLNAVPLAINADAPTLTLDFPNSWLIPLLRKNVASGATLKHFATSILPLAVKLKKRVDEMKGSATTRHVLDVVQQQLWDLLPPYCNAPLDLVEAFKDVARVFGVALMERPTLRLTVLSALRTLIAKNLDNEASKMELAKYTKNFLPILFNIYVGDEAADVKGYDERGTRLAALETIRVYVKIAPVELVDEYFKAAVGKIENKEESNSRKQRVMDILIGLVKYLNAGQMSTLFEKIQPFCEEAFDRSLQKKAFRVFEEIASTEGQEADGFMKQRGKGFTELLTKELKLLAPATKAARLSTLTRILDNSRCGDSVDYLALIERILPDVVLCLKEGNVKTRRSAARAFVASINAATTLMKKDTETATNFVWDRLKVFFEAGSTQEIQCTLVAARLFVFEFKNDVASTLISYFIAQVCRLFSDERNAVVEGCLEFLKTFVSCAPMITVQQYLDVFLPSLFAQNDGCRRHFRFLTRKVLAKLMRKFSYEVIKKFASTDEQLKQLNYLRKMLLRQEKRKKMEDGGRKTAEDDGSVVTGLSRPETIADLLRDTDDEDEPDFDHEDKRSRRSRVSAKQASIFIEENENDDDGDVVDLLDRKSMSKIVSSDVLAKKHRKDVNKVENHGFKTDDKGRLIIVDEEEEAKETYQVDKTQIGKRMRLDSVATSVMGGVEKKRRKAVDISMVDDEDADVEAALNYKPGGKGIHRNLDGVGKEEVGAAYRAKKGKGDVKKKGQTLEPYAYLPLDYRALNKRKRSKTTGTYKNLVHGAKKGASKGSKGRKKN